MKLLIAILVCSALKSPSATKLSYFEDCESKFFPTAFKWLNISALCGFYEQVINHLIFLMLISMNNASKPVSKSTLSIFLDEISSLSKSPPIRGSIPMHMKLLTRKGTINFSYRYQKYIYISTNSLA